MNMGQLSHSNQLKRPTMPSFDTVCEANFVEIKNAIDNTSKEITTRFDFKGTSAAVELKEKDKEIIMYGDAAFQLDQVEDVLRNKLTKRNVDIRFLDKGDMQKIGGDKVKVHIKVKNGIEAEAAKKITKLLKESKLKVQAAIQGDAIRVTGAKRDDLQAAMALIRSEITDMPVSFDNFRD
jgi:cyclic-di-GMP-binding protein